jgi:hypothetical protein
MIYPFIQFVKYISRCLFRYIFRPYRHHALPGELAAGSPPRGETWRSLRIFHTNPAKPRKGLGFYRAGQQPRFIQLFWDRAEDVHDDVNIHNANPE